MSQPNDYGNSCPQGGTFYACSTGSLFVGCCASDPCANECPAGNLRPTGFAAAKHGNMTDASCSSGSQFFTCLYPEKDPDTFWGCCKSNPCVAGSCAATDLAGAYLGTPAQLQAYAGQKPSASPSSSSSSPTSSPSSSTSSSPSPSPESSSTNIAAIAGGAAGGGVVLLALLGLLIFYIRRAKKAKQAHRELEKRHTMPMTEGGAGLAEKRGSNGFGPGDSPAPPMYTSPQLNHSSTFSPHPNAHSPHHQQWPHQQQNFVAELPAPLPFSPISSSDKSPHMHHNDTKNRLSELPAGATTSSIAPNHRLSELPAESSSSPTSANRLSELPVPSEPTGTTATATPAPARSEQGQPSERESLMPPGSPPQSPGFSPVVSPLLSSVSPHAHRRDGSLS